MEAPAPTTSPLVRRYSIDEFFALDRPAEGGHYELIGGVLYMVPPPDWPHNDAASRLLRIFARYADRHATGLTIYVPRAAIWTGEHTYLEPDLFLVQNARLATMNRQRMETADLVVEIVSPGSAIYDRNTKSDTYAALNVRELWLVDPEHRLIEVRELRDGRWAVRRRHTEAEVAESAVFPGLRVVPAELFA